METHNHEHPVHSSKGEVKTFYTCVAIIAIAIVLLQPLSMLAVIFVNAMAQAA